MKRSTIYYYYYHSWLFILLTLIVPQIASSQEQVTLLGRADEFYLKKEYSLAAGAYSKLADRRRPSVHVLERAANSYRKMNRYEDAENWYARLLEEEEADPVNLIHYAEVLKNNGKYTEARAQLQQYASITGNADTVALSIAGCDSAMVWMENPTDHRFRNEEYLNTELSEFGAFPHQGGILVAAEDPNNPARTYIPVHLSEKDANKYRWTGTPFVKLFAAYPGPDTLLGEGMRLQERHNQGWYHIGPAFVSPTSDTLWFTRTYPGRRQEMDKEKHQRFNLQTRRLELYYTIRIEGEEGEVTWTPARPFQYNRIKEYSLGLGALSPDGNTLYFASDMPGGRGNTDIWFSRKLPGGSWETPVNCGAEVNTSGDEMFPFIASDGALYFSSDGIAGMGGLDIFTSTGEQDQWKTPENMRYPVNSAGDDFAYVLKDEHSGYLTSNRRGGEGGDDIYSFGSRRPEIILALEALTLNKTTEEILDRVSVSLKADEQIAGRAITRSSGTVYFPAEVDQDYTLDGTRSGFRPDSTQISTHNITESDTLHVTLRLEPLMEKGKSFVLEGILYDFDKDNIRLDAAEILDELVQTMRDNPTLKIELSSHTDCRASHAYNDDLSQRRAQSAVNYLVSKGIARDRMVAKGYGERRLINECADGVPCSEEAHQLNRRTEVTVLEY